MLPPSEMIPAAMLWAYTATVLLANKARRINFFM